MFGNFGFPRMEVAGSALASTLAEFFAAIFALIYTFKTVDLNKYQLFTFHKFNFAYLKDVLLTAAPVMLQMFISLTSWFIFFMIVGFCILFIFIIFPDGKINFIVQDVLNYISKSNIRTLHNVTFGIGFSIKN